MAANLEIKEFGTYYQHIDKMTQIVPVAKVLQNGKVAALAYRCRLNKDLDGAPDTYANPKSGKKTRDYLPNAAMPAREFGKSNNFAWVGLVARKNLPGNPYHVDVSPELEALHEVQYVMNKDLKKYVPTIVVHKKGDGFYPVKQTQGLYAGYYISGSSAIADRSVSETEPGRFLDANTVPYAVLPDKFESVGKLHLGDMGLAIRNATGAYSGFFFGDRGSVDRVGESSGFLFESLQGLGSRYNGDHSTFFVFPGSGTGATNAKVAQQIPGIVQTRLREMASAPNFEDLVLFAASQCDLSVFKRLTGKSDAAEKLRATSEYQNLARSLFRAGFQTPVLAALLSLL